MSVEASWIILSNIVTIVTFRINRHIFRRAVYCLINLAFADMLYGVCLGVYWISMASGIKDLISDNAFIILGTLVAFSAIASGLCLVLVALERAFATFLPFRHRTVTLTTYKFAISLTWCVSLAIATSPYFLPKKLFQVFMYICVGFALSCLFIIVISYTAIFIKVRLQNRLHNHQQRYLQAAQIRERNMAYTLMLVTFFSILAWLPGLIVGSIMFSGKDVSGHVFNFAFMIQASNSFINSIIYALRMKDFRKALIKLMCQCSRDKIHPTNDVNIMLQRRN